MLLARVGSAAKGVVFIVIGALAARLAIGRGGAATKAAGGLQESLAALARAPHGHLVLGIVAVGLMVYGAFQLPTARYRHMRAA